MGRGQGLVRFIEDHTGEEARIFGRGAVLSVITIVREQSGHVIPQVPGYDCLMFTTVVTSIMMDFAEIEPVGENPVERAATQCCPCTGRSFG